MKATSPRIAATVRLGLAIRGDLVVARSEPSVLHMGEWSRALTGVPDAEGGWASLGEGLAELRALLPAGARVTASVVVLPPLAQLRTLDLPPLRPDERRHALTRDAARWFVGVREAQVVDAVPAGTARGTVVAAALPVRYAEAIERAAREAGIVVRTLQPAAWGWAALVGREERDATRLLLVPGGGAVEVVLLARGVVTGARRVRQGADLVPQLAAMLDEEEVRASQAAVVGAGTLAEQLVVALGARSIGRREDPAALAASMAMRTRGPELLPDAARHAHAAGVGRTARWLALAAAALVLAAAGVELWGVHRQLALVQADRAAIRAQVERAIATRDSATSLEAQYGAVATSAGSTPRWTAVLVDLTRSLPDDAHLVALTAAGDSVSITGEAENAAGVFEALRRDPRVAGLRADAPIRREFAADRTPVERFGIVLHLTPAGLSAMPAAEAP